MSGKPTNFMPIIPPLSVMTPAHLSSEVPRAVMNAAIHDPSHTTIEPTSREVSSYTYHGVRISNKNGKAVIFGAKVARRSNTLLERPGAMLTTETGSVATEIRGGSNATEETNVLVQLACVSETTWQRLDSEMLGSPIFYATVLTVVQDLKGLKEAFPPFYRNMLGDPRVLDLLSIPADDRKKASGIRGFMKDPSIDTFSRSVRRTLQGGASLFFTGQRALPDLPRKMVAKAGEMLRKKPKEDPLCVSFTDLDEPQPVQEAIIRVVEGKAKPVRLERMKDTVVLFQNKQYTRGSYDQMYVVRTRDFMERLVNWKRAFMIWSVDGIGSNIILMSNLEEARGMRSPHITIRQGLRLLLGERHSIDDLMVNEVERGYVRPGDNGKFEVFSLSGGTIFSGDRQLSSRAERVRKAFLNSLDVDVDFVEDDDTHRKFGFR